MNIKKAIIPIAGLGTRFLPLSKIVPKELWPLADLPALHYIVKEVIDSGIKSVVFVISQDKKMVLDYFKPSLVVEKVLKERKKGDLLKELQEFQNYINQLSISFVFQKKPLGDGDALLQAQKFVSKEPFAVLFGDDIVHSTKAPALAQLFNVFKTAQKPVLALSRVPKEKLSSYGVVDIEKIANRFYKIKEIVEKPEFGDEPSDLAIVGKYVLTPDIFDYLKKTKNDRTGEIRISSALEKMILDDKIIYGYEFEGKWLECGNKLEWLKSNIYLAINHPNYGQELKAFLKEIA